jgi:hypothetical protein
MKEKKTRKLICNITGKVLFASKDYYAKKVEKAGSEEHLHTAYMCKEATTLLKRNMSIAEIRHVLNVDVDHTCNITDDDAKKLVTKGSLRINNDDQPSIGVIKTDPDVKKFIKNILNHEK